MSSNKFERFNKNLWISNKSISDFYHLNDIIEIEGLDFIEEFKTKKVLNFTRNSSMYIGIDESSDSENWPKSYHLDECMFMEKKGLLCWNEPETFRCNTKSLGAIIESNKFINLESIRDESFDSYINRIIHSTSELPLYLVLRISICIEKEGWDKNNEPINIQKSLSEKTLLLDVQEKVLKDFSRVKLPRQDYTKSFKTIELIPMMILLICDYERKFFINSFKLETITKIKIFNVNLIDNSFKINIQSKDKYLLRYFVFFLKLKGFDIESCDGLSAIVKISSPLFFEHSFASYDLLNLFKVFDNEIDEEERFIEEMELRDEGIKLNEWEEENRIDYSDDDSDYYYYNNLRGNVI